MNTGFADRKNGECGSGVCQLLFVDWVRLRDCERTADTIQLERPEQEKRVCCRTAATIVAKEKTHYRIEPRRGRVGVDLSSLFDEGSGVNSGSRREELGRTGEKPTVEGTRDLETLVPEGFTQFPPIRRRGEVGRLHPSGRACPLVSKSLDNAEKRGRGVGLPAKSPGRAARG